MEPVAGQQPTVDGAAAGTHVSREDERAAAVARVVASAQRLGVELDEQEAADWIAAMESEARGGDLVVDVNTGVYGHRVSMADFAPADLARFRDMAPIVGFEDRPPNVLTALSISGSAAQSKINTYPADCDFFERINIKAPSREEACAVLSDMMREKALATFKGPNYRLLEVKFGQHPVEAKKGGKPVGVKSPMSWTPDEVKAGQFDVELLDGSKTTYTWADAQRDPGWCKVDWVIGDAHRGRLAYASNVLDPTWEAPDGSITPLDGFLDPYFQEVYLDADSIPLFSKLVKELSADTVDDYVEALRHEVYKYIVDHPSYGKVARRLYNIFRMSGRYEEAAFIRELFDEPITALYQVATIVETLGDAEADEDFELETMEAEMVGHLLRLRDSVQRRGRGEALEEAAGIETAAMKAVNDYFERMLRSIPAIDAYMDEIVARGH